MAAEQVGLSLKDPEAITEATLAKERTDAKDKAEPIENTEAVEPMEPSDKNEPVEPILRKEFFE